MRERIQAMKRIWSENEPEYQGEFADFDPVCSYPKPLQKGRYQGVAAAFGD